MINFPEGFVWGVATSAAQIEGFIQKDGKGLSIWDAFSHIPGNITDGTTTADACDSYLLYKKDIELMRQIGVNSYRFSVSWPRVLPEGKGKVNQKGLDYYKNLVDALLEQEIEPNITLYHWDLPYELHRLGGWLNRDCTDWFADYAELIVKNLGDRVRKFVTVNEPIATYVGYALKSFAPGFGLESYGKQACHNLMVAHGKAVRAIRALHFPVETGIVVDIWNRVPLDPENENDVKMAERENENAHRYFLNPLLKGDYTDYMKEQTEREKTAPDIRPGDMETIAQPLDFWGLNTYGRIVVSSDSKVNVAEAIKRNGGQYLSSGQEFYPQAVYESANSLREEYGLKIPIYVTENGTGNNEEVQGTAPINDTYRIEYIKGFLREIARANEDGLDIRGYYLWSLIDNFEWCAGNRAKFGICSVDPVTKERRMKQSAYAYADIIKNNGI